MGFFGMVFWIVVLWFAIRAVRRSSCLAVSGPRGSDRSKGWYDSSEFYTPRLRGAELKRVSEQQAYIDSLESRVSELEERLDFTERLLASRQESPAVK